MDAQKVDMFLMSNAKYFDGHQVPVIQQHLLTLDDSTFLLLQSLGLKDPTTMLIISLLAGSFGIDRFMLGDIALGVAKLLTCGGFGIWTIVDWFTIMGRTKEQNSQKLFGSTAM